MTREPQDIIKGQLGSLMMEIAVLTSQNEKLAEENLKLKEQLKNNVRFPDKPIKE